jgi:hypothetical protein
LKTRLIIPHKERGEAMMLQQLSAIALTEYERALREYLSIDR